MLSSHQRVVAKVTHLQKHLNEFTFSGMTCRDIDPELVGLKGDDDKVVEDSGRSLQLDFLKLFVLLTSQGVQIVRSPLWARGEADN